jgi:uncharacterized protein (DUF362 family)/NAD-dependent dihydropyrimidine dehydrogenase PreA subunit
MTAVVFAKCADYESAAVETAVGRLMEDLCLPAPASGARRTLIKPNLLTDRPPEDAVTTHPEVVRAIIRHLRRRGYTVAVGDSAAAPHKIERVWEATGIAAICADERTPLLNLEQSGARMFSYRGVSFSISRPVLEADLVVNAPKLKTHLLTILTGPVKNIFGVLPGAQKTALHKAFPTPAMLGDFIAHLYDLVQPGLTICDAITAMEGNGPTGGRPVQLGFLAAANDGVALEMELAKYLGVQPEQLPCLAPLLAQRDALAPVLIGDMDVVSGLPDFELPATFAGRLISARLVRLLRPWLWNRPAFGADCVRCGRCVAACPVPAITLPATGPPVLQPRDCIECGCCSEVCPVNAVAFRQSFLLRMVNRCRRVVTRILARK